MLIIKKSLIFFIGIVASIPPLLLGYYGYDIVRKAPGFDPSQIKFHSENFLYLAFMLMFAVLLSIILIAVRSRRLFRELDKISDVAQYGHESVSDYFNRMGRLGKKLDALFSRLNELNEMKSLKISSQANLTGFLIDNIDMNMLVLDASGKITQCSKKLLFQLHVEKDDILNKKITDLVLGLKLEDLFNELEATKKAVLKKDLVAGEKKYTGDYIFYPIFNAENTLSNIVCILESHELADELSIKTEHVKIDESKKGFKFLTFLKNK